jgi:hypothetical protein
VKKALFHMFPTKYQEPDRYIALKGAAFFNRRGAAPEAFRKHMASWVDAVMINILEQR